MRNLNLYTSNYLVSSSTRFLLSSACDLSVLYSYLDSLSWLLREAIIEFISAYGNILSLYWPISRCSSALSLSYPIERERSQRSRSSQYLALMLAQRWLAVSAYLNLCTYLTLVILLQKGHTISFLSFLMLAKHSQQSRWCAQQMSIGQWWLSLKAWKQILHQFSKNSWDYLRESANYYFIEFIIIYTYWLTRQKDINIFIYFQQKSQDFRRSETQ